MSTADTSVVTDGATIVARDLTVTFGSVTAIRGATFSASPGVTALIGPNGSGKTTLLELISGLAEPTSGTMTVLGDRATSGRSDVAHVLQATKVNEALPLTVEDVVRMGRYPHLGVFGRFGPDDRKAVADALIRMGVQDLAHRQLRDLSGGQQQRAFIAQGLAQAAPVLLLDEPVNGLDLVSQQRISEAIRREADAGRTVVLTTHDLTTAAMADHVVLLATHVVATGPPEQVLTADNLGHAYGGSAFTTSDGAVVLADPHHHGTSLSGHDH